MQIGSWSHDACWGCCIQACAVVGEGEDMEIACQTMWHVALPNKTCLESWHVNSAMVRLSLDCQALQRALPCPLD